MKKYIICPGPVISENDGEQHYITSKQLMNIYQVNPNDCLIYDTKDPQDGSHWDPDLIFLKPQRYYENYLKIKKGIHNEIPSVD